MITTVNKHLYIIHEDIKCVCWKLEDNVKKLAVTLLAPALILSALSGCITEKEETELNTSIPSKNLPPEAVVSTIGVITPTPEYIDTATVDAVAYAGDEVTFDASESYDPDGQIISYTWIFHDDTAVEGEKTSRVYWIDDNSASQMIPSNYSITLQVEDNNHSFDFLIYVLGVVPKRYTFYFDSSNLQGEKPNAASDQITARLGKLQPVTEVTYVLDKTCILQPCIWNATVYFKKPFFAFVNHVSLTLYNSSGSIVGEAESRLKMFDFWREKTVSLSGTIHKKENFKSVKLSVSGFSLKDEDFLLFQAACFLVWTSMRDNSLRLSSLCFFSSVGA